MADQASVTRTTATAAWDMAVSADSAARDAVSQANKATTTSQLAETTAALQQASDEFGAALVQLQGLEATVDGLDLSKQQEYLQKRIDTLGYAIATNEALAAGDRQTAAEQNELYEEGDRVSAGRLRSRLLSMMHTGRRSSPFKLAMTRSASACRLPIRASATIWGFSGTTIPPSKNKFHLNFRASFCRTFSSGILPCEIG